MKPTPPRSLPLLDDIKTLEPPTGFRVSIYERDKAAQASTVPQQEPRPVVTPPSRIQELPFPPKPMKRGSVSSFGEPELKPLPLLSEIERPEVPVQALLAKAYVERMKNQPPQEEDEGLTTTQTICVIVKTIAEEVTHAALVSLGSSYKTLEHKFQEFRAASTRYFKDSHPGALAQTWKPPFLPLFGACCNKTAEDELTPQQS